MAWWKKIYWQLVEWQISKLIFDNLKAWHWNFHNSTRLKEERRMEKRLKGEMDNI